MRLKKFRLWTGLFLALVHASSARAEISNSWLKLLHFKRGLSSQWFSEVTNREFFVAPDGAHDPQHEWRAEVEAFRTTASLPEKDNLACRFPARFLRLREAGALTIPAPSCPTLEDWLKKVSGDSLTLVFSSYYSNAPASMFGHTFLRIDHEGRNSILDAAFEYSAMTGNDIFIMQAVKGLFGWYDGLFSGVPYYIKIKEYNNAENRDIFEYHLNFSPEDVDFLLRHLWEMKDARLRYRFLNRNCSYEILGLLEAAKPQWDLRSHFKSHAAPIDTVRAVVAQNGALRSVSFRPSLRRRLIAKWRDLPPKAQKKFKNLIHGVPREAGEIQDPLLAEALGLHFAIRQIEGRGHLSDSESAMSHAVNLRRSQLPPLPPSAHEPAELPRPDLGHRTLRASFGFARGPEGSTLEPGWRPGLHGLLDRDEGYTPNSELEALHFRFRYLIERRRLALREARLLNVTSMMPYDGLHRSRAYEVQAGIFSPEDEMCDECVEGRLRAGIGSAWEWNSWFFNYLMMNVQSDFAGPRDYAFRFGPGVRAGTIFREGDRLKTIVDFRWNRFVNRQAHPDLVEWRIAQGWSWSDRSETHLSFTSRNSMLEGILVQHFYF